MSSRMYRIFENWATFALAIICGLGVASYCEFVYQAEEPPVFAPFTLAEFRVEPDEFEPGGAAMLYAPLCNNSQHTYTARLTLGVQRSPAGALLGEGRVALLQVEQTVPPGCVVEQPIRTRLPEQVDVGRWYAFLEVEVKGETANKSQNISALSNIFEVHQP